jgi:3-keto-L-gulonate-6-phosphate decarboxylase
MTSGAVKVAQKHFRKIVTDHIHLKEIEAKTQELLKLNVDYLCIHANYDILGQHTTMLSRLNHVLNVCLLDQLVILEGI